MHDLYLYAADPGSVSVMLPVWEIAGASGVRVNWIADGYAKNYFKEHGYGSFYGIDEFLEGSGGGEKVLFGSQFGKGRTGALLKRANQKGMKTYFLLDHWCNYDMNFIFEDGRVYPSESIFAMDELARDEMVKLGIPGKKIKMVGHPAIEKTAAVNKRMNREPNKGQALFLSEPLEQCFGYDGNGGPVLGYTQHSILRFFLECILNDAGAGSKINIIVKPHPKEDDTKLRGIVREYEDKLNIVYVKSGSAIDLMIDSEYVFGMTTILLLHSLAIGKKTGSIQVNRTDAGKEETNRHLDEALILDAGGVARVLNNAPKYKLRLMDNSAKRIMDLMLN